MYSLEKELDYQSVSRLAQFSGKLARISSAHISSANARDVSSLISELSNRPIIIDRAELQRMAEQTTIYSYQIASRIMGIACLVIMDLPQGKRFLIESVVVHQSCRRRGIGKALIQALIEIAREHGDGAITLTCNPTRTDAHAFYHELGFSVANTSVLRMQAAGQ